MAYKIIREKKDYHHPGREITAILDSVSDLTTLAANETDIAPGSVAAVAGKGMPTYVMNASGEWKNVDSSSGGGGGNLGELVANENGSYIAGVGEFLDVDGWSEVQVDVPTPKPPTVALTTLIVAENRTYDSSDLPGDYAGWDVVDVQVPEPELTSLFAQENDTYEAESYNVNGWDSVRVDVPPEYIQITVTTQTLSSKLSSPAVVPLGTYATVLRNYILQGGLVNVIAQARVAGQLLSSDMQGRIQLTFQGMGTQAVPVSAVLGSNGSTPYLGITGGAYDPQNDMAVYYVGVIDDADMLQFTKLVVVQNGTAQDMTSMAGQLVSNLTLGLYAHANFLVSSGD